MYQNKIIIIIIIIIFINIITIVFITATGIIIERYHCCLLIKNFAHKNRKPVK